MPLLLQAKILRVLETGEFLRVGDSKISKVNVRVIAATNRNLEEEIEREHFRSDLYYRLSVFTINVPSLRERKTDIKLLAVHYANYYALFSNRNPITLSKAYLTALEDNPWKGNIRELRNVVERSVILTDGDVLEIETLPTEFHHSKTENKQLSAFSMASAEKIHIQKVLNHTKGNKAEAARLLEIGFATLYRKIEEYGIGSSNV